MAELAPHNSLLKSLENLGEGTALAQQIYDMIGHSKFFDDFSREDVQMLAAFMQVYRAEPGSMIIREGDIDDYMLLIIQGKVDIVKTDKRGAVQPMTSVGPGMTLGEMSMIDGEPRFATCIAVEAHHVRRAVARLDGAHHPGGAQPGREAADQAGDAAVAAPAPDQLDAAALHGALSATRVLQRARAMLTAGCGAPGRGPGRWAGRSASRPWAPRSWPGPRPS